MIGDSAIIVDETPLKPIDSLTPKIHMANKERLYNFKDLLESDMFDKIRHEGTKSELD